MSEYLSEYVLKNYAKAVRRWNWEVGYLQIRYPQSANESGMECGYFSSRVETGRCSLEGTDLFSLQRGNPDSLCKDSRVCALSEQNDFGR